MKTCPNPECPAIDIPDNANFCPKCGYSFIQGQLVYVPFSQQSTFVVNLCKEYIERNKYMAKDTLCDLLSLSHYATITDIQDAIKDKIS